MPAKDLLKTYREKRDFRKTAEPSGDGQQRQAGGNRYLIQKHAATRLHFDLRLEQDGVLKSWAVTRGPSLDPKDKRLAVRTEDHPLDYGDFEGTIPKGEYGGGTVMLWDEGTWEPLPGEDNLGEGKLKFRLDGARLKGNWMLVRIKNNRDRKSKADNWLLFKERDGYAVTDGVPIVERALTSVRTGRTMEEIAEGNVEWTRAGRRVKDDAPAPKRARAAGEASLPLPKFVPPQMATLVEAPPSGEGWVHEIKYDGYRAIAAMAGGHVKIYTRNGLDWTDRFKPLVPAIADLPAQSALLDGEVAVPGEDGRTNFQALQNALSDNGRGKGLVYYLFDLLALDGEDLRRRPLLERKAKLAELLRDSPKAGPLLFSDHIVGNGAAFLASAKEHGLEGIVSKRADAPYRSERGKAWLKSKTHLSDEFVVVGWEASPVKGKRFAALLLASREKGKLTYRGKVGSGFGDREQAMLWPELEKRARKTAPVAVPADFVRNASFVKPELVVEVNFRGISDDNLLRQASFKALRRDKTAAEVDEAPDVAIPPPEDDEPPRRRSRKGEMEDGKSPPKPLTPAKAGVHTARLFEPENMDSRLRGNERSEGEAEGNPGPRKRKGKASPRPLTPAEAGVHTGRLSGAEGVDSRGNERSKTGANDNSAPKKQGRKASPQPLTPAEAGVHTGRLSGAEGVDSRGNERSRGAAEGNPAPPPKRKATIITIDRDKDGNAIEIEGVKVTNPNRILFPDRKITKRQLIAYQLAMADRILAHVAGRPLSLVRCPRGADEDCFFQKHATKGFPEEFRPIEIREKEGTDIYLYIEDKRGLVAAVQMGALELHVWGSHVKTLEKPDRVVFDFDPDPEVPFAAVKDGAREMRDRLSALGLVSFCMTTGGKGLHVVVPLTPRKGWDHIRIFAEAMARMVAQEDPKRYLAVMSKKERKGRIFIDYLRNGRGATAIAPFSTRARKGAPLSWPVGWKALDTLENAHPVSVETYAEALVELKRSDPWRGYFEVDQVVPG